jgi:hypothetical protein
MTERRIMEGRDTVAEAKTKTKIVEMPIERKTQVTKTMTTGQEEETEVGTETEIMDEEREREETIVVREMDAGVVEAGIEVAVGDSNMHRYNVYNGRV